MENSSLVFLPNSKDRRSIKRAVNPEPKHRSNTQFVALLELPVPPPKEW